MRSMNWNEWILFFSLSLSVFVYFFTSFISRLIAFILVIYWPIFHGSHSHTNNAIYKMMAFDMDKYCNSLRHYLLLLRPMWIACNLTWQQRRNLIRKKKKTERRENVFGKSDGIHIEWKYNYFHWNEFYLRFMTGEKERG